MQDTDDSQGYASSSCNEAVKNHVEEKAETKKMMKIRDNCLQYLTGKMRARNVERDCHLAYSKLNRSSVPPESSIALEDHEVVLDDYLSQYSKFPFQSSLPLPLLEPKSRTPDSVIRGKNPSFEVINNKREAWRKFNIMKSRVHRNKTGFQQAAERTCDILNDEDLCSENFVKIPKQMVFLAKAVENDPDRAFASDYNWYVTGGALCNSQVNGRTVLFYPGGNDLSTLTSVPVKKNSNFPTGFKVQEDCLTEHPSDHGQIFEIQSQELDNEARVLVRQKTSCKFFMYSRDEETEFRMVHEQFTLDNDCFTSVRLNPWNPLEYLTTTKQRLVQLWNLNHGTEPHYNYNSKGYSGHSPGRFQWNKMHFSSESQHAIFLTDESTMTLIDRRGESEGISTILDIKENIGLVNDIMPCESIVNSCNSLINPQMVYVATSHCLFSVDLRKPNWPLQSWKHCLSHPPVFLSQSCYAKGQELLLLASSFQKDLVGIVNSWPETSRSPFGSSQPMLLPSGMHTLQVANKLGLCSNPSTIRRLQSCRIGLTLSNSSRPTVFSTNSSGDIFCQRLRSAESQGSDELSKDSLRDHLSSWSETVHKLDLRAPIKPLKTVATWDASKFVKKVLLSNESEILPNLPVEDDEYVEPPGTWMMTLEDVFNCTDMLSPNILSSWGITSVAEWEAKKTAAYGEGTEEASLSQKISRVEDWLAKSSEVPLKVEIHTQEYDTQTQVLSQELFSVSQNVYGDSSQLADDVGFEAAVDKDVIKSRLSMRGFSVVPKKKRRKDGF